MIGLSKQDFIPGTFPPHNQKLPFFKLDPLYSILFRTPWRAALAFRQWRAGFNAGGPHKSIGEQFAALVIQFS